MSRLRINLYLVGCWLRTLFKFLIVVFLFVRVVFPVDLLVSLLLLSNFLARQLMIFTILEGCELLIIRLFITHWNIGRYGEVLSIKYCEKTYQRLKIQCAYLIGQQEDSSTAHFRCDPRFDQF